MILYIIALYYILCYNGSMRASLTEHSALRYLCREGSNIQLSTESGGSTRLIYGVEAMDDCSIRSITLGRKAVRIVQTTDFICGSGFELAQDGYLSDHDLGWYLASANLSDIAAMGAQPTDLHMIFRYPKGFTQDRFEETMQGFEACVATHGHGAELAGGDTGSYDTEVLAATATGVAVKGLLMQSGAQPGQNVYITGPTGLAGAARVAKNDIGVEAYTEPLIDKWQRVHPRVAEGLAVTRVVGDGGAGTDTSDGLKVALENIARKSNVDIIVDQDAVPIHHSVKEAARRFGQDPLAITMGNSVDFELLFTAGRERHEKLMRAFRRAGLDVPYLIGTVAESSPQGSARFHDGSALSGQIETHAA